MPEGNDIDRMLADSLTGQEKLKALFRANGYTYQSYAQERGLWPEQVKMTVYGQRPYPDIRDHLAEDLGLSRGEIDHLIDDEAEPVEEGAA